MQVSRVYLKDCYPFLGENDRNPYFDMYLPYNLAEMKRQDEKRPSMVVCPGGGYWMCSEREAEPIALKFLDMGFNVFVIYYSTANSGPHRYPAQLLEVAALFNYINKNAEELHVDTEKIGIIGFSAGGHLAAHYSNLWNDKIIEEKFGATYKPAANILCYAVISTENPNRGSFENLLGHFPETEEEINRFSCEKLVGKQTPPTFLFHTFEDTTVPVQNSIYYANALADNGIPFEMHIYPYGWHGLSTSDSLTLDSNNDKLPYISDWVIKVKRWINVLFDLKLGGI
ncbi:MAG: alpha/beta hydrolase [Clostridia bacterium]|nr:alpha/beta hydrolase [Clostridia bacterium]